MMDRVTNTFDGNMRIMRSTSEALVQGILTPTTRITFTYDHLGSELKRVREEYDRGVWNTSVAGPVFL